MKPEARLQATWPGAFILPAGVIIEGVCFQYKTHYMGPIMGIGIAAFGLQILSTNIYAYMTDVSLHVQSLGLSLFANQLSVLQATVCGDLYSAQFWSTGLFLHSWLLHGASPMIPSHTAVC